MSLTKTLANILVHPDGASIKRIAWAYGCAKKGSDEERQLLEILVARVKTLEEQARVLLEARVNP